VSVTVGPFVALDDDAYGSAADEGEAYDALTGKLVARNLNDCIAKAGRRMLAQSWPLSGTRDDALAYRVSTAPRWKPITGPIRLDASPHAIRAALRVRAEVPAGITVYLWAGVDGQGSSSSPPGDVTDASVLAVLGTGAQAVYPALASARHTFAIRRGKAQTWRLWMTHREAMTPVLNNTGLSTGVMDSTGATRAIVDTSEDFSTIDGVAATTDGLYDVMDYYVRTVSPAGDEQLPWRRVMKAATVGATVGGLIIDGEWNNEPRAGDSWELARGPIVEFESISVYEDNLTSADSAAFMPDIVRYERQKFRASPISSMLRACDTLYRSKRLLVQDPFILPQFIRVGAAYTTIAEYQITLSQSGSDPGIHVMVGLFGQDVASRADVRITTQDIAGALGSTNSVNGPGDAGVFPRAWDIGEARAYPVESRFLGVEGGTWVMFTHIPIVTKGTAATYRQLLTIEARKEGTYADYPDFYAGGVYAWETVHGPT